MDTLNTINQAIDYLEKRLRQPVTMEKVAGDVGYSRFYFERSFLAVVGQTPAAYLRKRRLSEAARALVSSRKAIVDIALEYQFQSQEAFTRAFKKEFRLTPLVYRRRGRVSGAMERITVRTARVHQMDAVPAWLLLSPFGLLLPYVPDFKTGLLQPEYALSRVRIV